MTHLGLGSDRDPAKEGIPGVDFRTPMNGLGVGVLVFSSSHCVSETRDFHDKSHESRCPGLGRLTGSKGNGACPQWCIYRISRLAHRAAQGSQDKVTG